jgi:adenylate cyclase
LSRSSGKISRFWSELKRRKVLRSLAIYAGTAFVILEASTIIFPRWGFPDWTIDLVLWLLILGAVVNVIIAWFYDLTPGGMQRTMPGEKGPERQEAKDSRGWKVATYLSLMVIVALIVWNVVGGSRELRAGDIRSLAILPFENYTGDDQLENLVAGMHSLLIGDMGRIGGLRVVGKTSSSRYTEAGMSAAEIAGELNVDALVEATVMCLGDSVCMQFRLISTTGEEAQLWVGEYSEDKGQILNLYNRVTKQIAEEVRIELTEAEENTLRQDRSADRDVIDAYIRSYAYWGDLGQEALDKAYNYLSQALQKDPEWAPIHAALAVVWAARIQMGMVEPDPGRTKISEHMEKAHALDADFADSHFINGAILTWPDWEWEKGEKELLKALAINPNHVLARMYYAHLLMSLQRMNEALEQGTLAVNLDPGNPTVLALYSVVLKGDGQHQAALETIEKALAIDPDHSFTRGQLGRALYNTGQYEKELEMQKSLLVSLLEGQEVPDLVTIYRTHGRQAAYQEVARLWELCAPSHPQGPLTMSRHYYRAGAYEKALDELEKALEVRNPNLPYIGTGTRYEALHDSVRFLAILDQMNLPHPRNR